MICMKVRVFFDAKHLVYAAIGTGKRPGKLYHVARRNEEYSLLREALLPVPSEAYNFLNKNNLSNPTTPRRSRDFGRITNRFGNRTMQLGLRFVF